MQLHSFSFVSVFTCSSCVYGIKFTLSRVDNVSTLELTYTLIFIIIITMLF